MARFLTFLVVLLLVILEVVLSKFGIGTDISLQFWPTAVQASVPAALALAVAFAFGLWLMLAGIALARDLPSPAGWLVLAGIFLAGLVLIAAARGDAPLIRAVSVAALGFAAAVAVCYTLPNTGLPRVMLSAAQIGGVGVVALLAASAVLGDTILLRAGPRIVFCRGSAVGCVPHFNELRAGRLVESESRFSGLGGGLGGWRISSAAALLLLTVVLTGAAVALATYYPKSETIPPNRETAAAGASRPAPGTSDKKEENPTWAPAAKGP